MFQNVIQKALEWSYCILNIWMEIGVARRTERALGNIICSRAKGKDIRKLDIIID